MALPKFLKRKASQVKFNILLSRVKARHKKRDFKSKLFIPFKFELVEKGKPVKREVWVLGKGFQMRDWDRPVVVVVNSKGEHMLFYRSTGITSRRKGDWLPVAGIEYKGGKPHSFIKYEGHPYFPRWKEKISREIKRLEQKGKIKFNDWNAGHLARMHKSLAGE